MKRHRILVTLTMVLAMLFLAVPAVMAEDYQTVSVVVDGIKLDADAYVVDGRTVVPLRAIFNALKATVDWNAATSTVTATKGSKVISLTVGQREAYINGSPTVLAVPPMLINERTFIPLRFVSEALGGNVAFDDATQTVSVQGEVQIQAGKTHEGTIKPEGETWLAAESPHFVKGDFYVEGKTSPVLTIEAGAKVYFEKDAGIKVGANAPGGLTVKGTTANPVVLGADTTAPQAGFWRGIRFYRQTMKGYSNIEGARIEYAGANSDYEGAVYAESQDQLIEVLMKNVEITNSLYSGVYLYGQVAFAEGSTSLKISGTKAGSEGGGFPIITGAYGSHNIPTGDYHNNALNAIHIWNAGAWDAVGRNTTWRNRGIPYAMSEDIYVQGDTSPTLTIEPGVITLWAQDAALYIGKEKPGSLIADAIAKPEGGGEWKSALDLGLQLANGKSLEPGCALCSTNKAIVFGAWNASPNRGAWDGIQFHSMAGEKSKINGAVIAYAGREDDYQAGIYMYSQDRSVKVQISNSMITGASYSGLIMLGSVELQPGSTGNYFVKNGWPIRVEPRHVGFIEAGNNFSGNDNQWINVWSEGAGWALVEKTATWRNHGIPYYVEAGPTISGTSKPVLTIEAGTTLIFADDTAIDVGYEGIGTLVAVGTADKPITFKSELGIPGGWRGMKYTDKTGAGNRLEYVTIEDAVTAISLARDLGAFVKNSTIRNSSECGIYRNWDYNEKPGTDYTKGNQFEGNAVDINED